MLRKLLNTQVGWAVLAGIAVGAAGMGIFLHSASPATAESADSPVLAPEDLEVLSRLDSAAVKLAERVMPSVVHINVNRGEGSGVVFRSDGYIITNDHVVANAKEVQVTFWDGRSSKGKVFRDELSDLAVIKVDRTGLKAATFADSEEVKPGQIVLAVGSPFGWQQSVTFGHVSAVGRTNQIPDFYAGVGRAYFDMIQTDAAINPGNSGGPLLNYKGEVIGINAAINSTSGSSSGVGFAIPSNTAKAVADQLVAKGKVVRAWLGLTPANMLRYEAEEKGVAKGAIVREVREDTPAGKAGLKVGDVITRIGNKDIRGELDVRNAMVVYPPGTKVDITYVRDGKVNTVAVTLGDRPADLDARQPRRPPAPFGPFGDNPFPDFFGIPEEEPSDEPGTAGPAVLGVEVRPLTDEEKTLARGVGVAVESVSEGSVAARAGVTPGSIIVKLGDKEIRTPEELRQAVASYKKGQQTLLSFVRKTRAGIAQISVTIRF